MKLPGSLPASDPIRAYHFIRDDYRSGEGNEPPWTIGETRTLDGPIVPCRYGYHGSPSLWDALKYAPGPVACIVELSGDVVAHGNPVDKHAASSRKLIAAVDLSRELRLFAADCAEHVLYLFEREYPQDKRPREAIQAARDFANGRIDDAAWAAAATRAARAASDASAANAASDTWDASAASDTWDASAANAAWAAWAANAARATSAATHGWAASAARAARDAEHQWQREQFERNVLSVLMAEVEK